MSYVSLSTVVVRDGHSVCHRICIYGAMMGRIFSDNLTPITLAPSGSEVMPLMYTWLGP